MPARTLLSAEQRTRLFSIPTDTAEMARHYVLGADDLAIVRTKAACQQPPRIRRPALPPSASGARAGPDRAAAGGDDRFRGEADRCRSAAVRRLCATGSDPPRACCSNCKGTWACEASVSTDWRACLRVRHGRRLGHGSRRAHRPGDARPSPREQHPSAFGGGAGAHRAGRACTGAKENLRGARGRDDRCRAGHAGGIADSRSGPAPVALRLAARLLGIARALEHRRAVGSPRIRARAGNRPGTRRAHPHHPPGAPDRRRGDHDRPAHRRARTRAANGDPRCPDREPRNPADRRDARHVREIHGDAVQPGAQPRREAFPGDPARRRQGSRSCSAAPSPPSGTRRKPARTASPWSSARSAWRNSTACCPSSEPSPTWRIRTSWSRRPSAIRCCAGSARVSSPPSTSGRARRTIPCWPPSIFSAPWTATAPARCPNGRRRRSCRRNGAG